MALTFGDAANNWLSFPENGSELSAGTGDFTFMARVHPTTTMYGAAEQGTVYSRDSTAFEALIYQGNFGGYIASGGGGGDVSIANGTSQSVGRRRSGSTNVNMVNETFGTTGSNSGNVSGSGSIFLGNRTPGTGGAHSFGGHLQDVAFWLVALTDAEMLSYARGFPARRIRPQSLSLDLPLFRDVKDRRSSRAFTFASSGPAASSFRQRTYAF